MLSYAFVVNQWISKMQAYEKGGNYTGLAYYYGMIIKNVFFFVIPEASSLDDTVAIRNHNSSTNGANHLTSSENLLLDGDENN